MDTYKQQVIYQIYVRSFCDSDGDGIGDLNGIRSKLDYLAGLGVDLLWLTPVYPSPQRDNGYDVADYRAIDPMYGTMEDFRALVREADRRGIGIMMDMVMNHTSTEHEWFRKALAGDEEYRERYFFRKGPGGHVPPTNWESKFGGNAWQEVGDDLFYLHLFDPGQADLNWENPTVRREMQEIINFWMDEGVRGFRFDVVNLISKADFQDDRTGDGRRFYTDGPRVHEFLQELNRNSFGRNPGIVTVGEMSSTSLEACCRYANGDGTELTMVFQFHHLKVDFDEGEKWSDRIWPDGRPYDFKALKRIFNEWQVGMQECGAWNALFLENHDQPRANSRFADPGKYPYESATLPAAVIHMMRGTPYIYQGEEIGMTNVDFDRIEDFRDVESVNYYHILRNNGVAEDEVLRILRRHSRDNGRTPMQWDDTPQAGFTTGTPWIGFPHFNEEVTVARNLSGEYTVLQFYRALVRLRKTMPVIADGSYRPVWTEHPDLFAYERVWKEQRILTIGNFSDRTVELPEIPAVKNVVLGNVIARPGRHTRTEASPEDAVKPMRPYEVRIVELV